MSNKNRNQNQQRPQDQSSASTTSQQEDQMKVVAPSEPGDTGGPKEDPVVRIIVRDGSTMGETASGAVASFEAVQKAIAEGNVEIIDNTEKKADQEPAATEPAPAVEEIRSEPSTFVNLSAPVLPVDEDVLIIGVGLAGRLVVEELKEYVGAMNVTRLVGPEKGAGHQAGLYNTFITLINKLSDQDFRPVMDKVLEIIQVNRDGVFHEANALRFMPHVTLAPARAKLFRDLVNLFTSLADPQSRRQALKQVDVERVLTSPVITEPGRQRVMAYFNV